MIELLFVRSIRKVISSNIGQVSKVLFWITVISALVAVILILLFLFIPDRPNAVEPEWSCTDIHPEGWCNKQ